MNDPQTSKTHADDIVIEAAGLVKTFGRTTALDGLDLVVRRGEVHGFLGPNGAGKSTTLRILLGLARASAGRVAVFERDPWRDAVQLHGRIAAVPGDVSIWPNLSGGEAIDLISRLRESTRRGSTRRGSTQLGSTQRGGTSRSDTADARAYAARKARLIELFQFDPGKKGRAYSKGNRQKVALIAAFATPADLYILDEPTSGLDPIMEAVFDQEIARVAGDGATVLLSSHILSEVEQLCDRVTIIRAGRTAETGTLAELRHLTRTEVSFVDPGQGDEGQRDEEPADPRLAALPGAHDLRRAGGRIRFTVDSDAVARVLPALAELDAGGLAVRGLVVAPPSLEELFLRHYGEGS